jgi:hypothetical protein
LSVRTLNPMLGDGSDRLDRARTLTFVPYLTGGILYLAAGALNPVSPLLLLISAAAASFGGTSGLAWMTDRLRRPRCPPLAAPPLALRRSRGWIVAAGLVGLVFVVVLGPGVRLPDDLKVRCCGI